ncbi:MAG: NAD(+)/NADH kinase [Candidatus Humimicrobiaceae bacterium]
MKVIGIISNNEKQEALEISKTVYDYLKNKNIEVLLPDEDVMPDHYSLRSVSQDEFSDKADAIISVGGDGTFLRASKYSFRNQTPVLGINAGHLGFLTEVDPENIEQAMNDLLEGSYSIEKRMLLEGRLFKDNKLIQNTGLPDIALNEFTITRSTIEKVIKMEIFVNDISIKSFSADGIIIATPTGSTAYSLSAGGPVVEPKAEAIVITPVCPHTLFSRSIILGPDKVLEVRLDSRNERDIFSVDGKTVALTRPAQYLLRVIRSKKQLNLISFNPNAFFKVFKEKFIERI